MKIVLVKIFDLEIANYSIENESHKAIQSFV